MSVPHHDGSPLYVDALEIELGDVVRVRLRVPAAQGSGGSTEQLAVWVRTMQDGEVQWSGARQLGSADGWAWWEAEVQATNPRTRYRWMLEWKGAPATGAVQDAFGTRFCSRVAWVNQAGYHDVEPRDAEDFAIVATPAPPTWMRDAVVYQVFPDRFAKSQAAHGRIEPEWAMPAEWHEPVDPVMPARSQQFFGGDLDGIAERLDYLVELGVTLLYLTPIFPAASNHRYDATTFEYVDPLLGGDEALVRLVDAAHERGIRVVGDLTTNHTGDTHEWFRAALRDPLALESSFYYFEADPADGEEHRRGAEVDPAAPPIARRNYVGWLGHANLPKLDWSSEALRERFVSGRNSVVRRFLNPPFNLDGWRIDVANMTGRLGARDHNAEVRRLIAHTVRETHPDALLVAESTNDATDDFQGDAWHGAMSYADFTRPIWSWLGESHETPYLGADGETRTVPWFFGEPVAAFPRYTATEFARSVICHTAGVPWRVRLGALHPLDTHDTARFANSAMPGTIPVAVGLQLTLPGIPMVFAGDELGLTGSEGESSRTPMPWASTSQPALRERFALYRELIAMRSAHRALSDGGLRWVHVSGQSLAFVRESAEETMLIVATSGPDAFHIDAAIALGSTSHAECEAVVVHGVDLVHEGDRLAFTSAGPGFAAWQLPGVRVPDSISPARSSRARAS